MVTKIWLFIIPMAFFLLYWILSLFKSRLHNKFIFKYIKYDKKIFRRLYYLFSILWSFVIIYSNSRSILNLKLVDTNKYSPIWNFAYVIAGISIFIFVWDFLFISCRNISSFVFKDIKITANEIEEIKITEVIDEKNLEVLNNVIAAESKLISDMSNYVNAYVENSELDEDLMYRQLVKKYAGERGDIKIALYNNGLAGQLQMQYDCELEDAQYTAILYSLKYKRSCFPDDIDHDIIYAVLSTCFNGEYIIILTSDYLYKNEHIIIQNLVRVFDSFLESKYKEYRLFSIQ